MKKDKQPDLQALYSMNELPPVDEIWTRTASIPQAEPPELLWENLTLDDRDILFSQALGEVMAKATQARKLQIKEFVEEDVALAVASNMALLLQ